MNEKTKESKFLDAINRYAEHQKAQITQEIEEYKNTKIEQATEQGLQDAYELIRDDISKRKAAIVNDVARQELALRNGLFEERKTICDEVFAKAEEKLRAFTRSEDYTAFLRRSLNEIAQICGDEKCTVSISPTDGNKRPLIAELLPTAEITLDNHILIGGIKVFCPALNIVMDDTLDARLEAQRGWFIENSGLKVM